MRIEIGQVFIRRALGAPPGTPEQRTAWARASRRVTQMGNVCEAQCEVDLDDDEWGPYYTRSAAQMVVRVVTIRLGTLYGTFEMPPAAFLAEWEEP